MPHFSRGSPEKHPSGRWPELQAGWLLGPSPVPSWSGCRALSWRCRSGAHGVCSEIRGGVGVGGLA